MNDDYIIAIIDTTSHKTSHKTPMIT